MTDETPTSWVSIDAGALEAQGVGRLAPGEFDLGDADKVSAVVQAVGPSTLAPRNWPCPCGSGKKYKKCCLRSE